MITSTDRVAIVGGGAAGALLALQLAARGVPSRVIDRNGAFARGVAYSARAPWHRLNVPIEKMGGWSTDESDKAFKTWYEQQNGPLEKELAARYVPRSAYGIWLQGELETVAASGLIELWRHEVTAVAPGTESVRIACAVRHVFSSPLAVFCFGNHPPRRLGADGMARIVEDMWAPGALSGIERHATVLIVGTGATAIDALLELHHRGHEGQVVMVSRRGLLPLVDAAPAPYKMTAPLAEDRPRLSQLIGRLRREAASAAANGQTWQSMIDAVRRDLTALWPRLSPVEQLRYVRHLRAYWLVHRHRLAPDIAALIEHLKSEGRLEIVKGRLGAVQECDGHVAATIVEGGRGSTRRSADWVVNCTGPGNDFRRLDDPLIRSLLALGAARPSQLGIGLDVDGDARLIDAGGRASDRLFVLGGATWPRFGEVTSAPQIRRRAALLTNVIADMLERAT